MLRWDIFCRIVDNYGDIGVCWRLSRQLAREHGLAVRLWIDDLEVANRLIAGLDIALEKHTIAGVEICHWHEPFPDVEVADVVIEAFACELPASYLAAIASPSPPFIPSPPPSPQRGEGAKRAWLNLEYLTAEQWAVEAHLLPSPHPRLPLTKHFFFPGFTAESGGLLREQNLIEQRDAFQRSAQAQAAFWKKLGVAYGSALKISLFCYPYAPLRGLLEAVAGGTRAVIVFVPDSSALSAIGEQLGLGQLMVADSISKGNLTLQLLPFLTQDDYDHLLWACDINFVRGEDSWVRALWAGKPLVWQPYHQAENAHLPKLQAFLDVYTTGLSKNCSSALRACHLHWCDGSFSDADWQSLLLHLQALQSHAIKQSAALAAQPDLASKLVFFARIFQNNRV